MKKLIAPLLLIAWGCSEPSAVQKTTLAAAALKNVVEVNSDFQQLVVGLSKRNVEFMTGFNSLPAAQKKELLAISRKYNAPFNASAVVPAEDLARLPNTTTMVGDYYITLLATLKASYVFEMSDLVNLISTEAALPITAGTFRSEVASPCTDGCQTTAYGIYLVRLNLYYSVTKDIIYSDQQASIMARLWLIGCIYNCNPVYYTLLNSPDLKA